MTINTDSSSLESGTLAITPVVRRSFLSASMRSALVDSTAMILMIIAVAIIAFIFGGPAIQRVISYAAIMLTAVIGLQIFSGNTGIVSFGHAGFMGIGAYLTGILTMPAAMQATTLRDLPSFMAGYELPFLGALLVVALAAIVIGLITGIPLLRLSVASAPIATLALLIIIYTILVAAREITRGSQPFYGVPRDVGLWTTILVASIALTTARIFRDTPFGLAARAASDDERGAAAVGVNHRAAWLFSWILSIMVAMASGAMLAQFLGAFSPRDFYFDLGFTILAMLIVGGMHSALGAFSGVAATTIVIEIVRRFEGGGDILGFHIPPVFGLTQGALALAMILIIWRRPEGLFGKGEINLLRRLGLAGKPISAAEPAYNGDTTPIIADHLTRRYAGVVAVDDASLEFHTNMITGIIGPNGAGKTTFLNMISGDVTPSSGRVSISKDLIPHTAFRFARHGIARTFQNIRIFPRMTVMENVVVAARQVEPSLVRAEATAMRELHRMGLADYADRTAAGLAYGLRRRLEIARALVLNPRFLLLDEPAAGMNAVETADLIAILANIRKERHIGIILIEHDMRLVMGLCERIVVIDHGKVIADGLPTEVQKNPDVIAAYLGSRSARKKQHHTEN